MFFIEHGLFFVYKFTKPWYNVHMIKKLLCKMNYHSWVYNTKYFPNIYAEIVTRYTVTRKCRWCGEHKILEDWHYDPETGDFV